MALQRYGNALSAQTVCLPFLRGEFDEARWTGLASGRRGSGLIEAFPNGVLAWYLKKIF